MTTPNQPNDERQQTNGVTERVAPSPIPPRPTQQPDGGVESGPHGAGQPGGNRTGAGPAGGQSRENAEQQPRSAAGAASPFRAGQQQDAGSEQRPGSAFEGQPQGAGQSAPSAPDPAAEGSPSSGPPTEQFAPRMNDDPGQGTSGNGVPGPEPQQPEGGAALPQREPQSNLQRPGHNPVAARQQQQQSGSVGLGGGGGATNARTTTDLAAKAARKEAAMSKSVGLDGPTRSIARPELVKDMPDLSEVRHPLPQESPGSTPQGGGGGGSATRASVGREGIDADSLRATVQIRRIDPWSTLKIGLVISVAMFFVWMLAVGLLYIVLEGMGVWERLNTTFTDMVAEEGSSTGLIDAGSVFAYAGVIGLINVVLFTALATVGTFIYNQCCDMAGGIQVTLADPD